MEWFCSSRKFLLIFEGVISQRSGSKSFPLILFSSSPSRTLRTGGIFVGFVLELDRRRKQARKKREVRMTGEPGPGFSL